jgi:hypothetical protein
MLLLLLLVVVVVILLLVVPSMWGAKVMVARFASELAVPTPLW